MSEGVHDIKKEVKIYYFVFAVLLILTVVTVLASHIHWGIALGIMAALIIAFVKGSLVASYFMHLRSEQQLIYIVLSLTVSFLIVMLVLFITSYYDPIRGSVYLEKERPAQTQHTAHDAHGGGHVP